ncbi:MAG: hypothetical protein JWP15_1415, partial [Alphaproteobacteria bacterium]|nr:hypothetical protein [Alphaproteobacteria bacterium]
PWAGLDQRVGIGTEIGKKETADSHSTGPNPKIE